MKLPLLLRILIAILLMLQYTVAGIITRRNPILLFVTMQPAYFTALGTSSSAATIPVTLRQTLRNGMTEMKRGNCLHRRTSLFPPPCFLLPS